MELIGIKTELVTTDDDIFSVCCKYIDNLVDGDVLVISSKIFSYCEGRIEEDERLSVRVREEADEYHCGEVVDLTRKCGIWVANAGIDRSNVESGKMVLWPVDPQRSVDELRDKLVAKFGLEHLGVMMIDSVCSPGRKGVIGACIAYSGFVGVKSQIGDKDIFGNELKITNVAVSDSLATAANLVMGEANEMVPIVIARGFDVEFSNDKIDSISEQSLNKSDCIFNPLFK